MVSGLLSDGARLSLLPAVETPDWPDDWSDWGAVLPLTQTVGEVHRAMVLREDRPVAVVTWHAVWYGPNLGSRAWNIGITVAPEWRGCGVGSLAQAMLAEHLFATTDAQRVEASTDIANVAEQAALQRAGFEREGVLRRAQFRTGGYHDLAVYAVLRPSPSG